FVCRNICAYNFALVKKAISCKSYWIRRKYFVYPLTSGIVASWTIPSACPPLNLLVSDGSFRSLPRPLQNQVEWLSLCVPVVVYA
uniref:Uncharacterized protein n=1 Tax=Felis catus TaxID=9685 RepID=A0ABI7YPW9_FELCA